MLYRTARDPEDRGQGVSERSWLLPSQQQRTARDYFPLISRPYLLPSIFVSDISPETDPQTPLRLDSARS